MAPLWSASAKQQFSVPPLQRTVRTQDRISFPDGELQEKAFAAGKIPGGFFKREGRPSENETLVSRLIDRPIRPLFPLLVQMRDAGHLYRSGMTWKTTRYRRR